MADIAQADVTVTMEPTDKDTSPDGRIGYRVFPNVAFGDGSLAYPTYGIPLPNLENFGLNFAIRRVNITQTTDGYLWTYDKTARTANPVAPYGTLRAFALASGSEHSHTAVAATSLDLEIVGK